ncbi:MAG: Modification methylase HaeIII [Candidatus Heimdallarchaeota archaeon LC_2]|nr:MAG: Modification methylase HaeIII [Candidatus Heimdallarchaeota archaeon LC_2]
MDLIDLFCGGGGSSRGFHLMGFKTICAIDQVPSCIITYNKNFGNVAMSADISNLRSEIILEKAKKKPFVVTASPPCEPFTLANENRIANPFDRLFDDQIGRLTIDAIRLIGDLDPEFFVIENVKGILDGEGKKLLAEEIESLGLGKPFFTIINAERFGVPSYRTRVLITNFKINFPNLKPVSLFQAINDLPDVNYPHEFDDHITSTLNEKHMKKIPNLPAGEGLVYYRGAKTEMRNYIRLKFEDPAPVIMGKSRYVHPTEDRLLTPREHARLMSFPDEHKFYGTLEEKYDMIGEAVPPLITKSIAAQLIKMS